MDKEKIDLNRKSRRALKAKSKKNRTEKDKNIVYSGDAYIDRTKVVHKDTVEKIRQRIADKTAKFKLPFFVKTLRKGKITSCLLINKDGRQRRILPDKKGTHCLYVHGNIAAAMKSGVCMLVRITRSTKDDGSAIDGSWAIVPAEARMMSATTIQTVTKRRFWFFRRYHYEISFDGRVQPAHLLYDYGINPIKQKQRLYISHEYIKVKKTNKSNDYFRFWIVKPSKK